MLPVSRPTLIFSSDPKVFIGIKRRNSFTQNLTYLRPFVIGFETFVVIFFVSTYQVTGPNRPLFIIYFGQTRYLLCFLLKSGNLKKKKNLKANYLPLFFGDVTGNTHIVFFGLSCDDSFAHFFTKATPLIDSL